MSRSACELVRITTGTRLTTGWSLTSFRTSNPFFLGRLRSSRIRSGIGALSKPRPRFRKAMAVSPSGATLMRAAELAIERARYDADRAERAFLACEPENRLVARSLEARWETRLTDLAAAQAALATQLSAQPGLPGREQLAATVADLPALWSAPTTSDKDRKRLLRTLLGDVTITPSAADPAQLPAGLRWKSGATQQLHLTRRKN